MFQAMSTGLAALVALKAVKNLLSPPLTLTIDSHVHEDVFHTQTLFSTEVGTKRGLQSGRFSWQEPNESGHSLELS